MTEIEIALPRGATVERTIHCVAQRDHAQHRQNLFLSFVYNVAGVPLSAGVLYPAFGRLLPPVVAAAAMTLSSVSVIANALRLRTVKLG